MNEISKIGYQPRKRLTPNFKLSEFIKPNDGTRWTDNNASPLFEYRLKLLAQTLEKIRAVIDSPIIINSGWRSPQRNKAVGGADDSAHMKGYAADFQSPYINAPALAKAIQRIREEGVINYDQLIEYPKHVHISIDPRARGQYWRSDYHR